MKVMTARENEGCEGISSLLSYLQVLLEKYTDALCMYICIYIYMDTHSNEFIEKEILAHSILAIHMQICTKNYSQT